MERPMRDKASWELRGMVKALNLLNMVNDPEEWERLAQAREELRIRAQEKQAVKQTVEA